MQKETACVPQLALELIEAIIDHLHDDAQSLCRCALVSRTWVARTRSHLFDGKIALNVWNHGRFISLLESPHCTVTSSIRSLLIDGRDDSTTDIADAVEPPAKDPLAVANEPGEVWISKLAPHFPALSEVHTLAFHHVHWSQISEATHKAMELNFRKLQALNLTACVCSSFDTMLDTISAFCNTPDIDIHKTITNVDDFTPGRYVRKKAFNCLTTDVNFPRQVHSRSIIDWLMSHEQVPVASYLHLQIYEPQGGNSLKKIVDYIRACGSTTTCLKLRFPLFPSIGLGAQLASTIDLSSNSGLEKIIISGGADLKGASFFHKVAWPILAQIDSSAFQSIYVIADELSFWVEERFVDFEISTAFFCRSLGISKTIKVSLYGYEGKEAQIFQEHLKAAVHEHFALEMSTPVAHMNFFERLIDQAQTVNGLGEEMGISMGAFTALSGDGDSGFS